MNRNKIHAAITITTAEGVLIKTTVAPRSSHSPSRAMVRASEYLTHTAAELIGAGWPVTVIESSGLYRAIEAFDPAEGKTFRYLAGFVAA